MRWKAKIAAGAVAVASLTGISAAVAAVRPVAISFASRPSAAPVPADFLGLSYEVRDVGQVGQFAAGGNLIGFLRSLGPGSLRLGGATADTRTAWVGPGDIAPAWATSAITPAHLDHVGQVARASGWRVLLTVNFGHFDPDAAAQETAYAARAMGTSLAGVEFGNEPDAFSLPSYGLRPLPWTFTEYRPQIDAYRAAVGAAAPSVPFVGPDQASGKRGLAWLANEAALERPSLLLAHYYPLAWCVGYLPTLGDLISPGMHEAVQRMLMRVQAVARRHRIPLRVDETNNISCAGEPGVSNTFSSALWAVDFLTRAMTVGVAGINFHGHMSNPTGYSPLVALTPEALRAGQLTAQPEWYAMLLAKQLLGDRPLRVQTRPAGLNLTASAFLSPSGRLHLVVVDDELAGAPPLRVHLPVGAAFGDGVALRLTAPALNATSGVRLGGADVQPHGGWGPAGRLPRVRVNNRVATFTVAPTSAVLVSLPPRATHR